VFQIGLEPKKRGAKRKVAECIGLPYRTIKLVLSERQFNRKSAVSVPYRVGIGQVKLKNKNIGIYRFILSVNEIRRIGISDLPKVNRIGIESKPIRLIVCYK